MRGTSADAGFFRRCGEEEADWRTHVHALSFILRPAGGPNNRGGRFPSSHEYARKRSAYGVSVVFSLFLVRDEDFLPNVSAVVEQFIKLEPLQRLFRWR